MDHTAVDCNKNFFKTEKRIGNMLLYDLTVYLKSSILYFYAWWKNISQTDGFSTGYGIIWLLSQNFLIGFYNTFVCILQIGIYEKGCLVV